PLVQQRGEAAALVLVDEYGIRGSNSLPESRIELLERTIPGHRYQPVSLAQHGTAIPIGIVEPLQCSLAARAQRVLVQRMRRIALQLDRPAVPHLGDDSAARRTLAAGGRVVVGDSRYGIVRAVQVGYELLYPIGAAPHG